MTTKKKAPKKPAKKSKHRRPQQPILPGTEVGLPPQIPEINDAADRFVDDRDEFISAKNDMAKSHEKLMQLMVQRDLRDYRYDNRKVERIHKDATEKIRVKALPEANGEDVDVFGEE